jgi:cytochrome c biogenesis protein CcmG, thiol:disulfide interchange protein DsbE
MKAVLRPVPLVALVALVALLGLLAYGVASRSDSQSIDNLVAQGKRVAVQQTSWPALSGSSRISLAALRGKVVLLNFWASWCPPCHSEAPLIERWQHQLVRRDATVIGIDVLDVTGDAEAFARSYHLTYPIGRDRDGSLLKRFQVEGYPETVVLDRQGRIAATDRGPVDEHFYTSQVLPLLQEPA